MSKRKAISDAKGGILMILSPAKTLDLSPSTSRLSEAYTNPECDDERTKLVAKALKNRKAKDLEKLLGISSNLAKTAHEYWSALEIGASSRQDVKPCIFSFSGAAYQGLQASECSDDQLLYLQRNLRIIDPLYGVLRPLDMMQPYRLEMATKKVFPDDEKLKLAEFWSPSVCHTISKDLAARQREKNKILLNLASDEYSSALDPCALPEGTQFIKVVFWEEGRTVSVHAKRARGLMVRYLAEHEIQDLEKVKEFNVEGYTFVDKKSSDTTLVFDRKKQTPKKAVAATKAKTQPAKKRSRQI